MNYSQQISVVYCDGKEVGQCRRAWFTSDGVV